MLCDKQDLEEFKNLVMQLKMQKFTSSQGDRKCLSHDAIASWNFLEHVSRKSFTM